MARAFGPPLATAAEAESKLGAVVNYTVTARDAVDGAVTPSCLPAPGSTFPLDATTVTCTAHDSKGIGSETSFTVTVTDKTGPTIAPLQDVVRQARSSAGTVVDYPATKAVDLVDGARSASCLPAPGPTFPVGTTLVTCTATDTRGNVGEATFRVTVREPS